MFGWLTRTETSSTRGKQLNAVKGALASLEEALEHVQSGDTILLSEGRHCVRTLITDSELRIQGIGKCVLSVDEYVEVQSGCSLSVSDIEFMVVRVDPCAKLWMTDCSFNGTGWCSLAVHEGSSLDLLRVQFRGCADLGRDDYRMWKRLWQ